MSGRLLRLPTNKIILYLVLWSCTFESAAIEIGDFRQISTRPPVRVVFMKHYQGTLSQCRTLTVYCCAMETISVRQYPLCIRPDIATLIIKPANIFSVLRSMLSKDYGAAVKIGDPIYETTFKYPSDGDFEAKEETDMYLLANVVGMFGTISSIPKKRL
jgi:hypothetical protein